MPFLGRRIGRGLLGTDQCAEASKGRLDEVVIASMFDDSSALHDKDLIRGSDHREAMGLLDHGDVPSRIAFEQQHAVRCQCHVPAEEGIAGKQVMCCAYNR